MVPESHLDMVRLGGALYSVIVEGKGYELAATFKSAVASVLHFPAGYSDAYRRIFSNGGLV